MQGICRVRGRRRLLRLVGEPMDFLAGYMLIKSTAASMASGTSWVSSLLLAVGSATLVAAGLV